MSLSKFLDTLKKLPSKRLCYRAWRDNMGDCCAISAVANLQHQYVGSFSEVWRFADKFGLSQDEVCVILTLNDLTNSESPEERYTRVVNELQARVRATKGFYSQTADSG